MNSKAPPKLPRKASGALTTPSSGTSRRSGPADALAPLPAARQGVRNACSSTSSRSKITAITTQISEAMITLVLKSIWPVNSPPSPPPPANTASVAIATVDTVAIRSPAMISGTDSGNSTRRKSWFAVIPMPRPASLASSGTFASPATMLR